MPDQILAGLVAADFEDRWENQQRELQRKYENGDIDADALAQAAAEHDAAEEADLRAALGDDGFRRWDREKVLREFNLASVNLSDTEKDRLYQLRKDMLKQRQDLQASARRGEIDEADLSEKLSATQSQYEQDSKALLGEQRYAAMNTGPDPAVANLRRQMKGLDVNDEQMSALVQAQQQWNQQRAQLNLNDDQPGYEDQLQALDAAREQAFQKILGPEGFAAYEKKQDPSYQALKHYANVWQLQDTDIDYLYGALRDYNRSVQDYQARASQLQSQGQDVDWDSVRKNIELFSQQTGKTLSYYLGDDRFKKLKQNELFNFSANN